MSKSILEPFLNDTFPVSWLVVQCWLVPGLTETKTKQAPMQAEVRVRVGSEFGKKNKNN